MSPVMHRIDETREALLGALAKRDWAAIGQLDLDCRACIEQALAEGPADQHLLRDNLERLLKVYRQLLDAAVEERQSAFVEISKIQQAQNAAKVYTLFG